MTERQWWSRYVRKALHRPGEGYIAKKAEDKFQTGTPDVDCMFNGTAARIELKYVKEGPMDWERALDLLRPSQRVWIEEWSKGGGEVLLLVGVDDEKIAYIYNATKLLTGAGSRTYQFTWSARSTLSPLESVANNIKHWLDVL